LSVAEALLEVAHSDERAVLLTVVEGPRAGQKLLVRPERDEIVGDAPRDLADLAAEVRRNGVYEHGELRVFAELYGPPPRLVVVGAVDTGEALCAAAKQLGWRTICIDARAAFATRERVPSADELIVAWPDDALQQVRLDHGTAVVVLTHDEKFDVPALAAALAGDAFYVGAIGSRRTQAQRRAQLLAAGVAEAQLERIHGPAGLDVGAETPAETAFAILAEALAVRAGRPGTRLQTSPGRIHAPEGRSGEGATAAGP
jgi:xanthine dehydrogenase accessory factor